MYIFADRNGTYYLRIVLSDAIARRIGQKEVRRSLRTKSKRLAWQKLPTAYAEAMQVIEPAMGGYSGESSLGRTVAPEVPPSLSACPTLSEVLVRFNKHQELTNVRSKTISTYNFAVNLFIRIAKDKSVDCYTKDDTKLFRDTVLQLPPRFSKLLDEGYSIRDIISLNKDKCISITSYNNYVGALSSVFSFAEKEGYISSSPFKRMKITQKRKASSYRDIISGEDITKILDHLKQYKDTRPQYYYIPLILYYTGARRNEIAQLYKSDVRKIDGVWCIDINDDAPDKFLKNINSARIIPVHSGLIQAGLLEYMDTINTERLFPQLSYSERNGYGFNISNMFTKLKKSFGLSDKITLHSFRHSFVHHLKVNDVPEPKVGYLVGHNSNSITYNTYGKEYAPSQLKDIVEKIPEVK